MATGAIENLSNSPIGAHTLHGIDETLVLENEEVDLQKHVQSCAKNPGHKDFIPVEIFTIDHLPSGYQDTDIFEFIQTFSALTVKIEVKMTSFDRPQFWPGSNIPYPSYDLRGSTKMRVGTGRVWRVIPMVNGKDPAGYEFSKGHSTCICHKCQSLETPSSEWWIIQIMTARHVVFDDSEGSMAKCRFFYDQNICPLVTLNVNSVHLENIDEDCNYVWCDTCDRDLAMKLSTQADHIDHLLDLLHKKFKDSRHVDKYTIIVSHPHGCPKQVSIGKWTQTLPVTGYISKYTYTTCTCPGSSGATVYILGYHDRWMHHVHCGQHENLNYSGGGLDPI